MNLGQTDSELRLHTQQIDVAPTSADKLPANPFVAALGIGVFVALIRLLIALGSTIQQLAALVREGADFAISLFRSLCHAP